MAKTTKISLGERITRWLYEQREAVATQFEKPLYQFAAFAGFVGALAIVMTAGFDLRGRSPSDLVIGEVAPFDVKATRDFAYREVNAAETAAKREAAAEDVAPVYDWQTNVAQQRRDGVSRGFSAIRAAIADTIRTELATNSPDRLKALEASTPEFERTDALLELVPASQRVAIADSLREEVFDPNVDVRISDENFATFARFSFSAEAENALSSAVSEVMDSVIVPNRTVIDELRDTGVYLRQFRGSTALVEYRVRSVEEQFTPMEAVPNLVEQVVSEKMTGADPALREAVMGAGLAMITPNTMFAPEATVERRQRASDSVEPVLTEESFRKGQIIVNEGFLVSERHVRVIEKMSEESPYLDQTQMVVGVVLLSLMLLLTMYIFGRRNIRKFRPRPKDLVFMGATMLLLIGIGRLGIALGRALVETVAVVPGEAWFLLIPVAAGGMFVRLVLNSEHAVIFCIVFGVLFGVLADNSLFMLSYAVIGGLVGASTVRQVKNRMALMWSGVIVGTVNMALVSAFLLLGGEFLRPGTALELALAFGGGLASGFLVLGVLPLFEWAFGYTTDIKLLELANMNHPALRELIMRAPGSYHHSMMVGSLCEAAAESIGCNPLLVRVGAYYHDIGKAKNPQYFAENQKAGENPHDRLKPNMSALVIKAHVKDGIEMARQHRLPVVIQDFIAQHHGTSLIRYFYFKAKEQEDPDIQEVEEKDYRYPGPRPQTRETAICLLADGIEAASRSMPDKTPARLKGLVQRMINNAFTDGQLDECDLTLKDLNDIAQAFIRILSGIYHHRPEYPSEKKPTKEAKEKPPTGETRRAERTTQRQSRVTPRPKFDTEKIAKHDIGLQEGTSDVWDIDEETVQEIEEENASRAPRRRDGEPASGSGDDSESAEDEGRKSLPRLGSR